MDILDMMYPQQMAQMLRQRPQQEQPPSMVDQIPLGMGAPAFAMPNPLKLPPGAPPDAPIPGGLQEPPAPALPRALARTGQVSNTVKVPPQGTATATPQAGAGTPTPDAQGDAYARADALREQAFDRLSPTDADMAPLRASANYGQLAGMMLQGLGGEQLAPVGGTVLKQAMADRAKATVDPMKRGELEARKLEAQAAAIEKRAQFAATQEERQRAREEANELRREAIEARKATAAMVGAVASSNRQGLADQRLFQREQAIGNDYEKATGGARKEYDAARRALTLTQKTPKDMTAMDQMGLVYTVMKMFDPDSVVRESEYAMAQSAQGLPDRLANYLTQLNTGKKLNPEQVTQMADIARRYAEIAEQTITGHNEVFSARARQWGVDPTNIVRGGTRAKPTEAPPGIDVGARLGGGKPQAGPKSPVQVEY